VYRAAAPDDDDLARAADRTREDPGRFNCPHFGAVYVALEPETAVAEVARNAGGKVDDCAVFVVQADLANVVDLSDPEQRRRLSLREQELTAENVKPCQRAAEVLYKSGVEAVIWPSAAGKGKSMAIYLDRLRQESKVEIVHSYSLPTPG
jgi:RES domain-containing protein